MKKGQSTFTRYSTQSTVTIPPERTFRNLDNRPDGEGSEAFDFCGCGWPQHMLMPKGNAEGLKCELFVMISDFEQDRVNQSLEGTCNDAAAYCGVRNRLYPDKKPMGYPMDRNARSGATNLSSFLTPNMKTQDFTIVFDNRKA